MIDPQRRAWLSRAWHGVLVLVVAASLATQVVLSVSGSEPGADPALSTRLVRLVSYFTIQSNLLVLIGAVAVTLRPDTDGPVWRVLRLDGVLGITITGIVYSTVLAGINDPQGAAAFTNFGFHHFAPWWALAGWLLFGPRPRIDRRTLCWAVLWPVLWIGWTLLHGAVTGWYPYPFTDVVELGYPAVLLNLAVVLLITVALATLLRTLDRRLAATGVGTTPPAGADTTPPTGADTTPPTGADTTSPAGADTTPPTGADTTPPAGAGQVAASRDPGQEA